MKEEYRVLTDSRAVEEEQIRKRIDKLALEMNNLVEFISNGTSSEFVVAKIAETENELNEAKFELQGG